MYFYLCEFISHLIPTLFSTLRNLVRRTKSNQLEDTNDTGANRSILGDPDKDFDFADLNNPVTFCDTTGFSGETDEYDVEQLQEWMANL